MAIPRGLDAGEADVLLAEHDLGAERRPRAPLAPAAMTDRDALRCARARVSHRAAHAAALPLLVLHCHLLPFPLLPVRLVALARPRHAAVVLRLIRDGLALVLLPGQA